MKQGHLIQPPQLVRLSGDGYYEWLVDGEMVYDFDCASPGDALRWVEHMAMKSWVTKTHLQQFAVLAANRFGVEYR